MKLKNILISAGSGIITFLCILLKIQTTRLNNAKAKNNTLEKEKKANKISRESENRINERLNEIKSKDKKDIHSDFTNLFK